MEVGAQVNERHVMGRYRCAMLEGSFALILRLLDFAPQLAPGGPSNRTLIVPQLPSETGENRLR
jgi:hypothetical protein